MDKKQIKKIVLSWWFWVIVAIISYFIFVSIPMEWNDTGFSFNRWEGINLIKTLLAYFTQIAWIIAISLLIFSGIKAIQKSKIHDYWKISFTILGIIGIIAYVIFSLNSLGMFDSFSNEYDERIGDLDNEKEIKLQIMLLEDDGYEVEYFYYALEDTELEGGSLKMKSLGNQNSQVWSGLFALKQVYPNSLKYYITILEPTRTCDYIINGRLYRAFAGKEELVLDGKIVDSTTAYQLINYQIDEEVYCS